MDTEKVRKVEEFIIQFYDLTSLFHETLMKIYRLETEPNFGQVGSLFPKFGTLVSKGNIFNYHYHGNGCTVWFNNIMLSYNNYVENNEISIQIWYFIEFMRMISDNSFQIDINEIDEIFLELEKENLLVQRNHFGSKVININNEYFKIKNNGQI